MGSYEKAIAEQTARLVYLAEQQRDQQARIEALLVELKAAPKRIGKAIQLSVDSEAAAAASHRARTAAVDPPRSSRRLCDPENA